MESTTTVVSTHCPYCALQCGMDLTCDGDRIEVEGNKRFPVNEGGLCLKGWSAAATLRHPDRLQGQLVEAARMLANARTAMVLTSRGAEQQSHGVDNVLAFINVALALGKVGRPFSGYGTITGQGNGQGGREHGQKADQLPGYRRIDDPRARRDVAAVWGIPESDLPGPGKSAYELIESAGEPDGIHALVVMGSNPIVSAPNATKVAGRFTRLDFLAVADFFLSETAKVADVVLPSAQWAEEDGTVTNLEGRVIRRRRALEPPAQARTDIDLLCDLAGALGKSKFFTFENHEAVFDELRAATRGAVADYSGISYDRIDREGGVFWPCLSEDHPGTPRLFQGAARRDGRH